MLRSSTSCICTVLPLKSASLLTHWKNIQLLQKQSAFKKNFNIKLILTPINYPLIKTALRFNVTTQSQNMQVRSIKKADTAPSRPRTTKRERGSLQHQPQTPAHTQSHLCCIQWRVSNRANLNGWASLSLRVVRCHRWGSQRQ